MKKILITGPMGQDGTILTKLLQNNNKLLGVCKMGSEDNRLKEHSKNYEIELVKCDLTNYKEVYNLISKFNPSSIVNFAGETDVINPWKDVEKTFIQNFTVPCNILNAIIGQNKDIFFFQSSSSLVYARSEDKIINEKSKFAPLYPYGVSKMSTQSIISEYRNKYGIKCSNGIFFNHESPYRSEKFISKKLSLLVSSLIRGENKKIKLHDLNFNRDISHAEDFMKGVKMVIDNDLNEDFIFSSGKLTNILEFSKKFFSLYNLDFYDYIDYEDSNDDNYILVGDNSKLKSFGWSPEKNVDDLIKDMINFDLNKKTKK